MSKKKKKKYRQSYKNGAPAGKQKRPQGKVPGKTQGKSPSKAPNPGGTEPEEIPIVDLGKEEEVSSVRPVEVKPEEIRIEEVDAAGSAAAGTEAATGEVAAEAGESGATAATQAGTAASEDTAAEAGTAAAQAGSTAGGHKLHRPHLKPWRVLTKTAKIVVIVIAVLIIAFLGFFHYEYSRLQKIDADAYSDENVKSYVSKDATDKELKKSTKSMEDLTEDLEETEAVKAEGDIFSDSSVYNILLIGTDDRTKKFSADARGDSCLLLSLNRDTGKVTLLSFERGIGVPILWGPYEGEWDWLTHSFRYGGADMMVEEIRDNFKVDVSKYIRINIRTLVKIIDAMGGIDIELTKAEANHLNHPEGTYTDGYAKGVGLEDELQHDLVEGMNHLNGTTAMVLARTRAIDDDWHRIERQRRVIVAAQKRLGELNAVQLATTLDAIIPLINTNLSETDIADLMTLAPNFLHADVTQQTIPADGTYGSMRGMDGRPMFAVDFSANAKLIRELLYGEEAAAEIGATIDDDEANNNRVQYSQKKGYSSGSYRSGSSGRSTGSSAGTGTAVNGAADDVVSQMQDGTQTETGLPADGSSLVTDPVTGAVIDSATGTVIIPGTDGTTGSVVDGTAAGTDGTGAAAGTVTDGTAAVGTDGTAGTGVVDSTAGTADAGTGTAESDAAAAAAAQAAAAQEALAQQQAAAAQAAAAQQAAQAAAQAAQQGSAAAEDAGGAMGQGAEE